MKRYNESKETMKKIFVGETREEVFLHCIRVSRMTTVAAQILGMDAEAVDQIATLALIHDIGKLSVRKEVLLKPTRLTDEEFAEMKRHAASSAVILDAMGYSKEEADIVGNHHERWDGRGYNGLKGEEIPYWSRLIALMDSVDAMAQRRCYSDAKSAGEIKEELVRCKGTQFDPELCQMFIDNFDVIFAARSLSPNEEDDAVSYPYSAMTVEGFSCNGCGTELHVGDKFMVCNDCGAVYCKDCVEDGVFADHICEDDE